MNSSDDNVLEVLQDKMQQWSSIVAVEMKHRMEITPARLAVLPVCDRSRPPFLFAIYDEHGEVVIDDC